MSAFRMSMILPILAMLFVVVWGGGLGVIFIVLNETGAREFGAIGIGLGLVVFVPLIAGLLARQKTGL